MLRSLELNNRAHSLSEVESYEELVEREIERRLERGGSTRGGRVHEGWVYGGRGGGWMEGTGGGGRGVRMIFSLLSLSNLERFNCHRSGVRRRINWARTRFELGLSAPLGDPLARLHGLRVRGALGGAGGQSLRILSFCSGHHTVELLEVDCLCHRARAVAPCEAHLEWGEEARAVKSRWMGPREV